MMYGIFDMDGTLYDSIYNKEMPYYREFACVLAESFVISEEHRRTAEEFYVGAGGGKPAERQYEEMLGMLGLPTERAPELARTYVARVTSRIYPLYDDAVPCLKLLRESGNHVCVSTGIPQHHLDRTVSHHGIDRYLDFWLGTSEQSSDKAMHRKVIREKFGLGEDEFRVRTFLVGDAFRDMQMALEWGVRTPVYVNRQGLDLLRITNGLEEKNVHPSRVVIISSLSALQTTQ